MSLHNFTIRKFHEGLIEKKFSAEEAARHYFDSIKSRDGKIGAYLRLSEKSALSQARAVDKKIAQMEKTGEKISVLAGAPLAIKDNILIKGETVSAASKILENYTAAYNATVIKKLKQAEAVFLGQTNMDEFAMGSSTENSAFQKTRNPYDAERVPGGSSGGSAAAVAADLAIAALGSDTGGSIRQPANFCGVVGLKPTYGAVSRYGLIAMASSLDQIGPIAKTAEDAGILFNEIKGQDNFDATSTVFTYESSELLHPNFNRVKKFKIGLPKEYFIEGLNKQTAGAIGQAIEKLKGLGFEFKEISLPRTKYALSSYYIIMPAEVSANLARFDGLRYGSNPKLRISSEFTNQPELLNLYLKNRDNFGEEVKRRIILGTFVLSSGYYDAYYGKAQKVRRLIKEDFQRAFDAAGGGVDVILTPVSPQPAFKFGEKTSDPLTMYLEDIFTIPVNLAGLPAISIPTGASGLPVGFQLIGKPFCEADILGIGMMYERN